MLVHHCVVWVAKIDQGAYRSRQSAESSSGPSMLPSNDGFQLIELTFDRKQLDPALDLDFSTSSRSCRSFSAEPAISSASSAALATACAFPSGERLIMYRVKRSVAHLSPRFVANGPLNAIEQVLLARLAKHQPIQGEPLLELFVATRILAVSVEEQVSPDPLHLTASAAQRPSGDRDRACSAAHHRHCRWRRIRAPRS